MPTTRLPKSKEQAHEISGRITNERPLERDSTAPEGNVSGGFNQKSRQERDEALRPPDKGRRDRD
ncbi:MAG: hypothetical protein HY834_15465 [Devosia nanyangense]|uniref:Uncharacterized protein n=1 Tax=Devosia nanyangense TaxID=1228055 RepID=A0A933L4Y5_9HYPH|nr:hypothetical protein [Devosia nanyangense]